MSKEIKEAVAQGNFLHFSGKGPNKAVLSRRPLKMVLALCSGPFVEPSRIARVSGSEEWLVRAAAARNKGTPPNIISKLAKDAHPLVRALALQSQSPEPSTKSKRSASASFNRQRVWNEIRAFLKGTSGKMVQDLLLKNARTPRSILSQIWKLREAEIKKYKIDEREEFATDPSAPASLLKVLIKDQNWYVRMSVSGNPSTPVSLLEELSKDKDEDVREAVASNSSTPVSLLEVLASDKDPSVRGAAASNSSMPMLALGKLVRDKNKWVRVYLAENSKLPLSLLEVLAKDKNERVRANVAIHPNTSLVLLDVLAKDKGKWVRSGVAENPNTPVPLSEILLEVLAQDKDEYVRRHAARNPNIPVALFEILAKDKDEDVRGNVACNPNIPVALLKNLVRAKKAVGIGEYVRDKIAANLNMPRALMEALAMDKAPAFKQKEVKKLLGEDELTGLPDASILHWITSLTDCPALIDNKSLTKASRSKEWLVRLAAVLHPDVTQGILELLINDTDEDVSAGATEKLSAMTG